MLTTRATALRASRLTRTRLPTRTLRFQTNPPTPRETGAGSGFKFSQNDRSSAAIIGGLTGGLTAFTLGYLWYHYSGAKSVVQTAEKTKGYFEQTFKQTKEKVPEPNEALQWMRQTSLQYAAVIPGAKSYVESAFDDLETVHQKHKEEVDQIIRETYQELQEVTKKGVSLESVSSTWSTLQKSLGRIADLAKDAGQEILNNHPELKEKFGGEFQRLQQLGDQLGPEAKKQVDETWNQIQDVLKKGFSSNTANQIKDIVQEKMQVVQKMGDEAWSKAMEQAKPYLDKSPKLNEMIEQNKDKLKQGNAMELFNQIKDAVSSGNTSNLENYVKETVNKVGESGGGLEQYFNMIPGGSSIIPKLSQLQEAAKKHGSEAEGLFKEAIDEIQEVLSKKVEQGKKLAEKAKKDSGS
jgi:gas vesicle protein